MARMLPPIPPSYLSPRSRNSIMLHFSCSKEKKKSLFSAQQQCFHRHEVEKRAPHPGEFFFISHHFSYWWEIKGRKDGTNFRKALSEAKEFLF